MEIVSVNIGQKQHYDWRNGTDSAIVKHSVNCPLRLKLTGFVGDEQADLKVHGGADKAVLVIPAVNYALFGIDRPFGFLGENLTLDGADESEIQLGDHLQVGEVLLEVSQPRSPCWKLNEVTGDRQFLARYAESGHVGFYCRVLQTGHIGPGASVVRMPSNLPSLSIKTLFLAKHRLASEADWQAIQLALDHPALSEAWRQALQKLLERKNEMARG